MAERVDVQRNVLMRLAQSRFRGIDLLRGVSASAIAGPIAGEYRPTVCRLPSPKGANEAEECVSVQRLLLALDGLTFLEADVLLRRIRFPT
jgi:hypothetical protein